MHSVVPRFLPVFLPSGSTLCFPAFNFILHPQPSAPLFSIFLPLVFVTAAFSVISLPSLSPLPCLQSSFPHFLRPSLQCPFSSALQPSPQSSSPHPSVPPLRLLSLPPLSSPSSTPSSGQSSYLQPSVSSLIPPLSIFKSLAFCSPSQSSSLQLAISLSFLLPSSPQCSVPSLSLLSDRAYGAVGRIGGRLVAQWQDQWCSLLGLVEILTCLFSWK